MSQLIEMLPRSAASRISDRDRYHADASRLAQMSDEDLLGTAETALRNLSPVDDSNESDRSDSDLRILIAPELCDRILPGSRTHMRRITSSIAEYYPDHRSPFRRLLSTEDLDGLARSAEGIRGSVALLACLDAGSLVQAARFAIAGSRSAMRWSPSDCVYEPAFAYRIVPTLALRAMHRRAESTHHRGDPSV